MDRRGLEWKGKVGLIFNGQERSGRDRSGKERRGPERNGWERKGRLYF